jgi:hypothetical protein
MRVSHTVFASALASACLLLAGPAYAQQQYIRQIERQLDAVEDFVARYGLRPSHNRKIDIIRRNQSDSYNLELDRGVRYMLVGVCDNDCNDVDIYVYDDRNRNVAEFEKFGDLAAVVVNPPRTAQYRIVVSVPGCRTADCLIGVGVYGAR